jgi:hypothetical protein
MVTLVTFLACALHRRAYACMRSVPSHFDGEAGTDGSGSLWPDFPFNCLIKRVVPRGYVTVGVMTQLLVELLLGAQGRHLYKCVSHEMVDKLYYCGKARQVELN